MTNAEPIPSRRRAARIGTAVSAGALIAVLAACSSGPAQRAAAGSSAPASAGQASSSSGASPTSASATSSGSSGSSSAAAMLTTTLLVGIQKVSSVKLQVVSDAAGQAITAHGVEKVSQGKAQAVDITTALPQGAGSLREILIGGTTYVMLPTSLRKGTSGTPWTKASTTSSNPVVASIAKSNAQLTSQASLQSFGNFAKAASNVQNKGSVTVNGTSATLYSVTVDVNKLASLGGDSAALKQAGLTSIPVDIYVDSEGRPVKVTENFTAANQKVSITITLSDYNAPVSISAPPASQVGS